MAAVRVIIYHGPDYTPAELAELEDGLTRAGVVARLERRDTRAGGWHEAAVLLLDLGTGVAGNLAYDTLARAWSAVIRAVRRRVQEPAVGTAGRPEVASPSSEEAKSSPPAQSLAVRLPQYEELTILRPDVHDPRLDDMPDQIRNLDARTTFVWDSASGLFIPADE